jgi:hypothetical protein
MTHCVTVEKYLNRVIWSRIKKKAEAESKNCHVKTMLSLEKPIKIIWKTPHMYHLILRLIFVLFLQGFVIKLGKIGNKFKLSKWSWWTNLSHHTLSCVPYSMEETIFNACESVHTRYIFWKGEKRKMIQKRKEGRTTRRNGRLSGRWMANWDWPSGCHSNLPWGCRPVPPCWLVLPR